MPALYLACSPEIARLEFEKHSRKVGLAVSKPGMTVSVEAHLERVRDLTSPEVRSELGVSLEDLCGESPHRTRSIGDAARLAGYQGIRYPAAVDPTGSNVVVFEENAGEGALQIVARDDDWPQESK